MFLRPAKPGALGAISGDPDGDGNTELLVQGAVWDWDGSVMKDIQDLANPQSVSMA